VKAAAQELNKAPGEGADREPDGHEHHPPGHHIAPLVVPAGDFRSHGEVGDGKQRIAHEAQEDDEAHIYRLGNGSGEARHVKEEDHAEAGEQAPSQHEGPSATPPRIQPVRETPHHRVDKNDEDLGDEDGDARHGWRYGQVVGHEDQEQQGRRIAKDSLADHAQAEAEEPNLGQGRRRPRERGWGARRARQNARPVFGKFGQIWRRSWK
jgi:hypothetical protein